MDEGVIIGIAAACVIVVLALGGFCLFLIMKESSGKPVFKELSAAQAAAKTSSAAARTGTEMEEKM